MDSYVVFFAEWFLLTGLAAAPEVVHVTAEVVLEATLGLAVVLVTVPDLVLVRAKEAGVDLAAPIKIRDLDLAVVQFPKRTGTVQRRIKKI